MRCIHHTAPRALLLRAGSRGDRYVRWGADCCTVVGVRLALAVARFGRAVGVAKNSGKRHTPHTPVRRFIRHRHTFYRDLCAHNRRGARTAHRFRYVLYETYRRNFLSPRGPPRSRLVASSQIHVSHNEQSLCAELTCVHRAQRLHGVPTSGRGGRAKVHVRRPIRPHEGAP